MQFELDSMEKCDEYMYNNSLNLFSMAIGPFEKLPTDQDKKNASKAKNPFANLAQKKLKAGDEDDDEVAPDDNEPQGNELDHEALVMKGAQKPE